MMVVREAKAASPNPNRGEHHDEVIITSTWR